MTVGVVCCELTKSFNEVVILEHEYNVTYVYQQ